MLQEQQQQLQQLLGDLHGRAEDGDDEARRSGGRDRARRWPTRSCAIERHRRERARPAREGGRHQRAAVDGVAGARGGAAGDRVDSRRRSRWRRPRRRRRPRPARRLRRRPVPSANPTDRPGAAGRLAAADVRPGFDDYTAGHYDLAIQGFQSYIQAFPRRQGRRRAAEHRALATTRRASGRGARRVPEGDHGLPAAPTRADGVLQAGTDLRAAEAARSRAEGVRDRRSQKYPERQRRPRSRKQALEAAEQEIGPRQLKAEDLSTLLRLRLERNIVVGQLQTGSPIARDARRRRRRRRRRAALLPAAPPSPPPPPPPPSRTTRSPRISVV